MNKWRWISLFIGIGWFSLPFLLPIEGLAFEARVTMAIFLIAAWYWITEPIPIYVTSLMIVFLQVFLLSNQSLILNRIGSTDGIKPPSYESILGTLSHPIIILFLGGFVLARAASKYQMDKMIIRVFLKPFGSSPAAVLAGIILVTSALSAFVSNTATTAMMMTVIFPLVAQMKEDDGFRVALALSIPFAANIGGIITPIASPPNAVVLSALEAQGKSISFTDWMIMMLPIIVVTLFFFWFLLVKMYPTKARFNVQFGKDEAQKMGWRLFWLYFVSALTVILWFTEALHGIPSALIALIPVIGLTAFGLIDRDDIRGLSWEVLWLVAGGISLGSSMKQTGLAEWIVMQMPLQGVGVIGIFIVIALAGWLLATFMSHTVTASLLIPVVISLFTSGMLENAPPLEIMGLTVVCASSLGMMLPISTPPNAIAAATGLVSSKSMMKIGFLVGLMECGLLLVIARYYWPWILG
jgi:sodium-dependent dicarboxylate transporter 2/3/5